MTQFLKNKSEIISWLNQHRVVNYCVNDDLSVNVDGSVDLTDQSLFFIPVRFRCVEGDFLCSKNKLTNLLGSPQALGRHFRCDNNCLTSLLGSPEYLYGSFHCNHNNLRSLEHCPKTIERRFNVSNNALIDFEFLPQKVVGLFFCHENPALGSTQDITSFDAIKNMHLELKKIKEEKCFLEREITKHSVVKKSINHKI